MFFLSPRKRALRRIAELISWLALVALFQGCSSIKMGYSNAQHLAYWWVNSYLSLTDSQTASVREAMTRLHQWHSQQELPRYVAILQDAGAVAGGDVSAQQVCEVWSQAVQRVDALLVAAVPDMVHLAGDLQPAQWQNLERRMAKSNAEFRAEWFGLSATALLEKQFDKVLERTEKVYGRLDPQQKALLKTQVEQSSASPQNSEADRVRRQKALLQLLRQWKTSAPPPAEAALALRGTLANWLRVDDAGKIPAPVQEWCTNVAALHNQTTPAQRQHAQEWLRDYEVQLSKLVVAAAN